MSERAGSTITWRVPAQAVIGALLIIVAELVIAGAGIVWTVTSIDLGIEVTMSDVLRYVVIALALIPLLLVLYGLIRRRLGPMRLGALLSVIPAVIVVLQPTTNFPVLIGLVAATVIGLLLIFTAKRPKSVIYR